MTKSTSKIKTTTPRSEPKPAATIDRIHDELVDSIDEELEMEIDDDRLRRLVGEVSEPGGSAIDRRVYFKELFRLQGELVKLQSG